MWYSMTSDEEREWAQSIISSYKRRVGNLMSEEQAQTEEQVQEVVERASFGPDELREQRRWNKLIHEVSRTTRDLIEGDKDYIVTFSFNSEVPQEGTVDVFVLEDAEDETQEPEVVQTAHLPAAPSGFQFPGQPSGAEVANPSEV